MSASLLVSQDIDIQGPHLLTHEEETMSQVPIDANITMMHNAVNNDTVNRIDNNISDNDIVDVCPSIEIDMDLLETSIPNPSIVDDVNGCAGSLVDDAVNKMIDRNVNVTDGEGKANDRIFEDIVVSSDDKQSIEISQTETGMNPQGYEALTTDFNEISIKEISDDIDDHVTINTIVSETTEDQVVDLFSAVYESLSDRIKEAISEHEPTIYCEICLDDCSEKLKFQPKNCSEKHTYCKPCMSGYYSALIKDGTIHLFCPGVATCRTEITTDELSSLLPEQLFERFERLQQVKQNPLYRECPMCGTSVIAPSAKIKNPTMQCDKCSADFCFFHSNAHPGLTCQDYARSQSAAVRKELAASRSVVGRTTKNCPGCQAPTEKNGGCNHMTCQTCRQSWCWLCEGKINGSTSAHYNPGNFLFGCPGGQHQPDHNIINRLTYLVYDLSPSLGSGFGRGLRLTSALYGRIRCFSVLLIGIASLIALALPSMLVFGTIYCIYKRKFSKDVVFKIIPIVAGLVAPILCSLAIDLTLSVCFLPIWIMTGILLPDPSGGSCRTILHCLDSCLWTSFIIHLCH